MVDLHISRQTRDAVRQGAIRSSDLLAEMIVDLFSPVSTLDVGCGEGYLPQALRNLSVDAMGVDGDDIGCDLVVDLAKPPYPDLGRTFDVVSCLEVAEHVPAAHAADLVAWLCQMAPITFFSAAIPHQGGDGHINEQPPKYWVDLFAEHGRVGSGSLRAEIWEDERIESWYRQNLLVFAEPDVLDVVGLKEDGCPYLVHPVIWGWYRHD